MFTGIVETIGVVEEVKEPNHSEGGIQGSTITIVDAETVLSGCNIGDSISVNGVRLSISEYTTSSFKIVVPPAILDRTNLGKLVKGDELNLERTVTGGHVVQGHVNTVATVADIQQDKTYVRMTFEPEEVAVLDYIVEKGFISLEGASLIVTNVTDTAFSVTLAAHKQSNITLGSKKIGDVIKVEVDLFNKLIEKQLARQKQAEKHAENNEGAEAIFDKFFNSLGWFFTLLLKLLVKLLGSFVGTLVFLIITTALVIGLALLFIIAFVSFCVFVDPYAREYFNWLSLVGKT